MFYLQTSELSIVNYKIMHMPLFGCPDMLYSVKYVDSSTYFPDDIFETPCTGR
jgi:hypothetical protein